FSTKIECPSNIVGDITHDGSINFLDLVLLISWIINGNIPSDLEIFLADMTNDGVLDIFDILILTDII
ncbi:MAG: dockerin type I domain-containing protein, partial [Fidelibacterota bacterium]